TNQLVPSPLPPLSSLGQLAPLQFQAVRFLSVLLIALALLPLFTALKCYAESDKKKAAGRNEYACLNSRAEYCLKIEIGLEYGRACDEMLLCPSIGETCIERNGGTMCCCKGDLCNNGPFGSNPSGSAIASPSRGDNPAATPTALLSLAALAAAIAAHY
ncbi:hypothetical protein PMAYCL1PPCAC_03606, partial [Pristionchus mayeri]